jgi:tetratricopeptide (TPR) repeat protein
MVEQRQLAERARVAGNAAMAAGQWSEALRCYETGLDAQRHNMALHANAALAALKKSCYVLALEHCDKVGALRQRHEQRGRVGG